MKQAITIKVLGATNTKGTRLKVTSYGGSITVPFDYSAGHEQSIRQAVDALLNKLEWRGEYIIGGLPSGDYVAVFKWVLA